MKIGVAAAAVVIANAQENVPAVLHKLGYPNKRVNERAACGERHFDQKLFDYYITMVFHGFRPGACAEKGYSTAEASAVDDAGHEILVFTRDPTMVDVAECFMEECGSDMSTLIRDGYSSDVSHCISPAFGPCQSKVWDCLGDETCLEAVECGPHFVKECGQEIADLMSDPDERKKLECVETCSTDPYPTGCTISRCGKTALDCLDGADDLCHRALTCAPKALAHCSKPAIDCLFQTKGLCHQNLKCFSDGVGVCADPAVNILTDSHVADAIRCANSKCPAATTEELPHLAEYTSQPAHYAGQLACVGLHCHPLLKILGDDKLSSVMSCAGDSYSTCETGFYECLGDEGCRDQLHCWADGLGNAGDDVWKMLTDDSERAFDMELFQCVESCHTGNKVADAFCLATHCGKKALHCLSDTTCKAVLLDIPSVLRQCGPSSRADPMFMKGVQCAGNIGVTCGKAGLEVVRDTTLADLVSCQTQCTRTPSGTIV
jgi:hypothetical protein